MPERERGRRRPAPFFLVNNAGVFKDIAKRSKTTLRAPDGIEIHWRINFLGTFHLISLLPPLLQRAGQRTGDARVVITSSDVHHKGYNDRFFVEHTGEYNSWDAYAQAKLALVHLAFEIQRRYAQEYSLQSVALHPGSVRTNLTTSGLDNNPIIKRIYLLTQPLMAPFFLTLEQGAQTTITCATKTPLQGGQCYEDCRLQGIRRGTGRVGSQTPLGRGRELGSRSDLPSLEQFSG